MRGASLMAEGDGFTLIELIVVLIVLGILAVFVMPNMRGLSAFQERGEYDRVVSTVEYARKAAIAQRRYVCVAWAANSLTLTIDPNPPESTATPFSGNCPFANTLVLPAAEKSPCGPNQTCLTATTISVVPAAPANFQFDALGRTPSTVSLTVSGFPSITIEGETGHVH